MSRADSCLFVRIDQAGVCLFILYVDDALLMGTQDGINKAIEEIKGEFAVTTAGTLQDFLGCKITRDDANNTTYVTQPYLLEKMAEKYKNELPTRTYKTPGTPGFVSNLKYIEDKDVLSPELTERSWSGVGMLL